MIAALLLTALATVPLGPLVETRASAIECNSVHCADDGRLVLTQLIVWEELDSGRAVVGWRMWQASMTPHRCSTGWCLTWLDGDTLRTVRAVSYVESWTTWDTEIEMRQYMPCESRRGLGVR